MLRLTWQIGLNFSKWSKPKPTIKNKEVKKFFAAGDDKSAKTSKSQHELENKAKMLE